MQILSDILSSLPDGEVRDVRLGLHWTVVVVETGGVLRCGLSSTLFAPHRHDQGPDIPLAGHLEYCSGLELADLALSPHPTQASVGIAAINALLPRKTQLWSEDNAEEVIAGQGHGKRVVMVGRFPFVPRLRPRVGELWVLEQDPGPDDLPADQAPQVLPAAEVVAITGMTLINHTLEGLLALCSPKAFVILLGPSTPLTPLLFDYGVDILSGAVVTAIEPVQRIVAQGGNFRQVHRAGIRLVNMQRQTLKS
jgi:uncharacterized protein (DUF4213/DUF364 family)